MVTSRLMLAAENIIEDKSSDALMIYSLFEKIASVSFPYLFQKFQLLTVLDKEDQDSDNQECIIKIFNNDKLLSEATVNISFFGQNYTRVVYTVSGVTALEPGNLKLEFYIGNEQLDSYFIRIEQVDLSA